MQCSITAFDIHFEFFGAGLNFFFVKVKVGPKLTQTYKRSIWLIQVLQNIQRNLWIVMLLYLIGRCHDEYIDMQQYPDTTPEKWRNGSRIPTNYFQFKELHYNANLINSKHSL